MAFHLRCELPERLDHELNASAPDLTDAETRILKDQIRKNAQAVAQDVRRLELFLLKEKYPSDAEFIQKIRKNLKLSMQENDTFRKVLWRHFQSTEARKRPPKV